VVALVVASATLAGCGRVASADRVGSTPTTIASTYGGGGAEVTTGSSTTIAPAAAAAGGGTTTTSSPRATTAAREVTGIDVVVADTHGAPVPAVAVRLEPQPGTPGGPTQLRAADDGHLRAELPAGRYRLAAVEGCAGQLRVLRAGGAAVDVAAGSTSRGTLVVDVQPRFEVAGPVRYDGNERWRVGEVHPVRFRLVDTCDHERAPSPAAYTAVRFEVVEGVEVVRPLSDRITDDGEVRIDLRCTGAADVGLEVVDGRDANRRREVLRDGLLSGQSPPFCA
jgi:hypothetical protein